MLPGLRTLIADWSDIKAHGIEVHRAFSGHTDASAHANNGCPLRGRSGAWLCWQVIDDQIDAYKSLSTPNRSKKSQIIAVYNKKVCAWRDVPHVDADLGELVPQDFL